MKRPLAVLLVGIVVLGMLPVASATVDDPRFETNVPEPRLTPGLTQELTVQIVNDAEDVDDQVLTASNVEVTAREGSTPISVVSGTRLLGEMHDGVPKTVSFQVEVPQDAQAGTYSIPIKVAYEFDGDERETTTVRATVTIPDRPVFAVESVESNLYLDDTGVVHVRMRNEGSEIARDTTLTFASQNPALSVGGASATEAYVGRWEPGTVKEISFPATTSPAAISTDYAIRVHPTYRNDNNVSRQAPPKSIGVRPATGNRFAVRSTDADVVVGERGSVAVTLENRGTTTLTDASVRLQTTSPSVNFEGQQSATQFVGEWAPGETRTITAEVTATQAAEAREHSLTATVSFQHPEGIRARSGPFDVGMPVGPEQSFSIDDVSVDVQATNADLTAAVTNDGDQPVHDGLVILETTSPSIRVLEPTAPIGTLGPGETTQVTFDLGVAPGASPGARQFDATVQYSRDDGQTYRSDTTAFTATFPTDEDVFTVESVNSTFGIDTTNELRVRIRNEGDEPLTDVYARLMALPPYRSQSPTAYVNRLEPGQSAVMTFEVTTPEDAVPTDDALRLNVTAETADDETLVTGPYLVPITVATPGTTASDTTALAVGAVVVVVILGMGWWWLNR